MELPFIVFVLVGFLAQMIDGALGMAYGVSSNTFLLSLGIPPAAASASVHMAEVVTTGISGFSHWRLGNVDWKLVRRLLIPGVIGGVTGAYVLTSIDSEIIKPYIAAYLLIMGGIIIYKAFTMKIRQKPDEYHGPRVSWLGLFGGFCDAIGGGGWGPVVTSTLVANGKNPRMTIGSVNFTEFFVTTSESILFINALSFGDYWQIILGLLIGGAIAAPIAAKLSQKLPVKTLMIVVGVLIIILSLRTIYLAIQ
jgi:uncharacterized membrane protein YfcA